MEISDITLTRLFALSEPQIVSFFRKKKLQPTQKWTDVLQEAHNRAFVVAGVTQADVLQDIYNAVDKAIGEGTTFEQFKKELKEKWTPEHQERRLRTVYNTNLSVAYSRGRYDSMRENAQRRPFWRYKCQFLPGSRESHKALHGKIFRWDDPIWNTLFPPNDWGCQCEVEPLTAEEVGDKPVETSKGKLFGIQKRLDSSTTQLVTGYKDPKTDEITAPSAGWNYNPGVSDYTPDMRKYNSFIGDFLRMKLNTAAQKMPFIQGAHDFKDDLLAVNPLKDYGKNCVSCTLAYEARRRGLDVIAKPFKEAVKDVEKYTVFQGIDRPAQYLSKEAIEKKMQEYGDGARMEITAVWDKKRGHSFIAEQIDGKTHFLDPQQKDENCEKYFKIAKTILAARVDNKLFSSKIKNFIQSIKK